MCLAVAGLAWRRGGLPSGSGLLVMGGVAGHGRARVAVGCRARVLWLYLASKRAWCPDRPSSELAEGAGLLTLRSGFYPRGRRAWPLAAGARLRWSCGLRGHLLAGTALAGGDGGVPGDGRVVMAWTWRSSAAAIAARAWSVVSGSFARPASAACWAA